VRENLEVLRDLFNDQNAFEQGKLGVKLLSNADIENQMVFKSRKEILQLAKKYEKEDDEDAFRDMNEYETTLMKRFEDNDQEIDEMLDKVIEMANLLKGHAQNINTAITTQADLIKKVNNKAEKARNRLQKRASELQGVLDKYRRTNKMCVDMVLVVILLVLIGIVIKVLKVKGYM
jgi:t-SNARE complex subunit (syntaxin)